jgi:hypothetical protein
VFSGANLSVERQGTQAHAAHPMQRPALYKRQAILVQPSPPAARMVTMARKRCHVFRILADLAAVLLLIRCNAATSGMRALPCFSHTRTSSAVASQTRPDLCCDAQGLGLGFPESRHFFRAGTSTPGYRESPITRLLGKKGPCSAILQSRSGITDSRPASMAKWKPVAAGITDLDSCRSDRFRAPPTHAGLVWGTAAKNVLMNNCTCLLH